MSVLTRGACILVVEDEPSIRDFMRTLLREEGYRVETAIDGLDALHQLPCDPDLILLDLQMPVMTGQEFLGRLRNMQRHSATPVLIVTAYHGNAPIEGAQGVLAKPFDVAVLLHEVSTLIGAAPN